MTVAADGPVRSGRGLSARNLVRIVTRGAGERARARAEAFRHSHPVGLADELDASLCAAIDSGFEMANVIPQRLPRAVRERATLGIPQKGGKPHRRRFEMALH